MQVNVTARHTDLTPALKGYAEKKLLGVKKYVEKVTKAHVILNVEKDRHIAEVVLDLSKSRVAASAVAGDMYSAIDMVMDKVNRQVKRHMDKVKEHRDLPYTVVANIIQDEKVTGDGVERVTDVKEVRELAIEEQSVSEAISHLEDRSAGFWLFRNSSDGRLNVVYSRKDGSYGMLIIMDRRGE